MRGTLAQLRGWASEGAHGVKWGALIARSSDKLQLLLQEVRHGLMVLVDRCLLQPLQKATGLWIGVLGADVGLL